MPLNAVGERRKPNFWDWSASGSRLISRPIVIDGLTKPYLKIEIAPRIKVVDGHLYDDSFEAVEHMANQLIRSFTLQQLVMATVALQIHMRKARSFIEKKRLLQERWTALARRMKRLRIEESHLSWAEEGFKEKRRQFEEVLKTVPQPTGLFERQHLLENEERELKERRERWLMEEREAKSAWTDLEREDDQLLREAPFYGQEDLRRPYILTLVAGVQGARKRSLASAMNVLVEALQRPLSRTDQALLEIALRRCVRDQAPYLLPSTPETWERELLQEAEAEFLSEFPWAEPFRSPRPHSEFRV